MGACAVYAKMVWYEQVNTRTFLETTPLYFGEGTAESFLLKHQSSYISAPAMTIMSQQEPPI